MREMLAEKGMNQAKLAALMGVERATITRWLKGESQASRSNFETILNYIKALNIDPSIFLVHAYPEIEFIERVSARPRAGTGGLETDAEYNGVYAFHKKFIARKRGTRETMKIFEVAGDSMEPTLSEGDLIMINLSDKIVTSGKIYLVRIDDELMVKRLENRPGVLLFKSDNKIYDEISVDKSDESKNVEIYGRMVWSCREY
jgi:phage repressor protein C with HTH and peptisase S24 domain